MAGDRRAGAGGLWTPANVVTCVRIALIPAFMALALLARRDGAPAALSVSAFLLYAALSLTDKLDGHLARSRGEVTDFGKFLDPIADKLLVFSALLLLMQQGSLLESPALSVCAVFLVLARELLVSALRMVASAKGVVIAAGGLGKAKTAVTMVSLCGYYLAFAMESLGAAAAAGALLLACHALMGAAVVLTAWSGAQYFWASRGVLGMGE